MSTMKDKLTASVRQAKSAQQAGSKKPVRAAAKRAAPSKTPVPPAAKPAAAKPAAPRPAAPAAQPVAPKRASAPAVHAGGIPDSNGTLHPQRIWPD